DRSGAGRLQSASRHHSRHPDLRDLDPVSPRSLAARLAAPLLCLAAIPFLDGGQAHAAAPVLHCGAVVEQDDFTKSDTHGDLSALGSAFCRAVAAARGAAVRISGYPDDGHGLSALQAHTVDLLVGSTPNAETASRRGLAYAPAVFHDGQGFLMRRSLQVGNVEGLRDKVICYLSETPADDGLIDALGRRQIAYRPHPFEEAGEMEAALVGGSCDVVTADVSALGAMRRGFHAQTSAFELLSNVISDDPFAPVMRAGDTSLDRLVALVDDVLTSAADAGITGKDVRAGTADPDLKRLSAQYATRAQPLGLDPGWVRRVLKTDGNRREILARTVPLPAALLR
ncbi:MAG: hypothetical protein ACRYG8_47095, partial [Janthinobacterium lividum]